MIRAATILFAVAGSVLAWDTPPHRAMTKAAIDALRPKARAKLAEEVASIVETYCILPDRYVEMEQFGFARKSAGPRTVEELRPYCVRPDGQAVHSATFERERDLGSLIFLFERMLTARSENKTKDLAMYAGVLAHFVEDSLSPPHSVIAEELKELAPDLPSIHGMLERSVPSFTIADGRQTDTVTLLGGLESLLDRIYRGAAQNRAALPDMIAEAQQHDPKRLDQHQLFAAKTAAEILRDALEMILADQE